MKNNFISQEDMMSKLKNFIQNGTRIDLDYKTFIITEDMCDVVVDSTKGVAPYNTSYGMTWITIKDGYGVEWREGWMYRFIISTKLVVASATRNVGIRIGSGAYIPAKNWADSILSGNSYFIKGRVDEYMYKTTYESGGALHLCAGSDTTYENKSASSSGTDLSLVTTGEKYTWNNKQDVLTLQTAYTSKGTSSKVPQISTNNLGQVTGITEIDITYPSQVSDIAYASTWNGVTTIAPSKNVVYDKIASMDTAINGKLDGFTRMFAGNWSGGVHPVRFCSVNYTTATSENGVFIKMSLVNSHGNGQAGRFLEDVILLVTYTGSVECSIYRYFGTPTLYPGDYYNYSYGDIFWTIDTTNKIVDFFVLMHQYSYTRMSPYFRLNRSTGGVITQASEGTGNLEYSSGDKSRASIYDYSKIPSKTSQLTNDSGFITSSDLPTVNNSTITYTQAGDTITTTTTNQGSASTVALRGDIFVTQTEYNDLPSTKTTDGNTYIIYKT